MSDVEPLDPEETDLTTVKGIGDTTAEQLSENGYDTVGDLIDTQGDASLGNIDGIAESTAASIQSNVASRVYEHITQHDETQQDEPTSPDEFIIDGEEGVTVDLTIEDVFMPFVIHVLYEEVLYQHRMSNEEKLELAKPCALAFARAAQLNDSEEYTFTMSDETLEMLYGALRRGVSDYGSRSGITRLYGRIHQLSNQVDEYR